MGLTGSGRPVAGLNLALADGVPTVWAQVGTGRSAPDNHLLARWWANGKPVVPAVPAEPAPARALGWGIASGKRPELRLALDLAWDRLGAKSSDLIAVQLVYCEYGTEAVSDGR